MLNSGMPCDDSLSAWDTRRGTSLQMVQSGHGLQREEYMTLLSKEEFGEDLFEAIRLQAGFCQATKTADLYQKKGLKKMEREHRAKAITMNQQLQAILKKNTIPPADLQRLLAIT